jgi:hypothetical protein
MRDRNEFDSEEGWRSHLEHEVEAAHNRGDKKDEDAARRELEKLGGQKGATKRPRSAASKETR